MNPHRRCQILVVEDSLDDISILRRALETDSGMSISHVSRDGQDALDYLLRQGEHEGAQGPSPDLILLDIHLPRVDGFEVLRRTKSEKSLASIPVIMFTSSAREEDVARSYEVGANTYIQKPSTLEEYSTAVTLLEQYWGVLAKLPPVQYNSKRIAA